MQFLIKCFYDVGEFRSLTNYIKHSNLFICAKYKLTTQLTQIMHLTIM